MAQTIQIQPAGAFSVAHVPGAAAQATITKAAAGAGVRLICNAVTVSVACAATAQTPIVAQLLDGATVVWAVQLACPANDCRVVAAEGLSLFGSANTAMTLQFTGAGVAGSFLTVTLTGYVES